MCLFKNGVGVIFSNGDRAIVINNMLIGTDVCIDIESYNGDYSNNINSNLNIVKIYSHLSDKWNQVKGNYIYGLLKNIEDSELLFDYERYKITIRDITSLYCVGDADYKYPSLKEAEKEYANYVRRVTNTLTNKGLITTNSVIFKTNEPNYKATIFCFDKNNVENEDAIFPVKIIMERY